MLPRCLLTPSLSLFHTKTNVIIKTLFRKLSALAIKEHTLKSKQLRNKDKVLIDTNDRKKTTTTKR